ncbi:12662_t:CDS:2, partial [Entrophospora sp. SA101]
MNVSNTPYQLLTHIEFQKDSKKKYLCTEVEYFTSEKVLRNHQKYCYGHTDAPQFTELPEKSKNDNGKVS